jgi:NAD(P)-dependent dehydrogenase (short-subunit alcohol dehydrogenase family)
MPGGKRDVQVQLQDKSALLVGEGGEVGAALAAALAASGARIEDGGRPDLAVLFCQDGGVSSDQLATAAHRVAATMADGGTLLTVVSVTGLVPMRGDATAPLQAAAMAFTRGLALDLAPRGIRVNALAIVPAPQAPRVVSHIPGRRVPDAAAVAAAALFLLDPENSYTTGHVLVADGGWSIGYGRDF